MPGSNHENGPERFVVKPKAPWFSFCYEINKKNDKSKARASLRAFGGQTNKDLNLTRLIKGSQAETSYSIMSYLFAPGRRELLYWRDVDRQTGNKRRLHDPHSRIY
jgi:hypothetical protein